MRECYLRKVTLIWVLLLLSVGCAGEQEDRPSVAEEVTGEEVTEHRDMANVRDSPGIRGVYGNPATLLEEGYRFKELGMTAVFVRSVQFDEELYRAAREEGMQLHIEFPTLLGRDYVDEHPDAWPIDETGEPSPQADWFMGVCPTHPGFIEHRESQLREILGRYEVDGIFLDYVHWHAQFESDDPILPETCFCDRCLRLFSEQTGAEIPAGETADRASWILENEDSRWREWRSEVLNGWIAGKKEIVRDIQPDAKVGIFHASWFPEEHNEALYRTLGIDLQAFAEMADVLSPMLFHRLKAQEPAWVGDYIKWLDREVLSETHSLPEVWPIVQAHNNPDTVSPDEFRQVMIEGVTPPVTGIMMFSDQALLEDPRKIEVMRELYHSGF